jgi:hypothetical protein
MLTSVNAAGTGRLSPSEYFSPTAQPISSRPAAKRMSQFTTPAP